MAWWLVTTAPNTVGVRSSASRPTNFADGPFATQAQAQAQANADARLGIKVSGSSGPSGPVTPSGGCGPKAIYTQLLAAGFSTVQAVGVMANMIAESGPGLDPEARVVDSNGRFSNGLVQFNEASYPDSGKLVTGNCAQDIIQQIGYLKSHVSGQALNGATGAQVASNFAANFERCVGCQSGGSQNSIRTANAAKVEGWISSGNWPAGGAGISGSGGGSGGGGSATLTSTLVPGTCVIPLNIPIAGQFCLLSKGQARGVLGVLLMIGGGLLLLPGLLVLAAGGLERTSAGQKAAGAAAMVMPPPLRVIHAGAVSHSGDVSHSGTITHQAAVPYTASATVVPSSGPRVVQGSVVPAIEA